MNVKRLQNRTTTQPLTKTIHTSESSTTNLIIGPNLTPRNHLHLHLNGEGFRIGNPLYRILSLNDPNTQTVICHPLHRRFKGHVTGL